MPSRFNDTYVDISQRFHVTYVTTDSLAFNCLYLNDYLEYQYKLGSFGTTRDWPFFTYINLMFTNCNMLMVVVGNPICYVVNFIL